MIKCGAYCFKLPLTDIGAGKPFFQVSTILLAGQANR